MIGSIQLQNYKAFSDVTIPVRPLTVLLGANSAGKSSIIQMLMLLHQTAEEDGNTYSSALKIYGNYVNAGAYEYLLKDRKIDNPLRIQITLASNGLVEEIREMKNKYISNCNQFVRFCLNGNKAWDLLHKKIKNKQGFQSYMDELIKLTKKEEFTPQTFLIDRLKRLTGISVNELRKRKHEGVYKVYDFLSKLSESCRDDILKVEFEIRIVNNSFSITGLWILSSDSTQLIGIQSSSQNKTSIKSDLVALDKNEQHLLLSYFNQNQTIFNCIRSHDDSEDVSPIVYQVLTLLQTSVDYLKYEFGGSKINYVSPLRAHPKRYYMLDKAKTTISLDTLDGDQIAEVLKDNKEVKKNVNSWFSRFGLEIDVKGLKEVIHHLKVNQHGLTLDITDVGFGISQVLPIITQGFLSQNNSTTIIEQPEIHLHPRMQADLGDLFIDIVKDQNKKLVIETHSEYLLKRIRRRISEGAISPNDVSICLFHAKTEERDAWVELLEIGEKGDFKWPEEYYGGELSEDTFVFLKNQA